MSEKKKRVNISKENQGVAVARVEKLIEAGNPSGKAIETVAKEFNVSVSAITNWRTASRKKEKVKRTSKKRASKKRVIEKTPKQAARQIDERVDTLDLALGLLNLASKIRSKLNKSSRKHLLLELQTRLS